MTNPFEFELATNEEPTTPHFPIDASIYDDWDSSTNTSSPDFMDSVYAWRGLDPKSKRPYAPNQADSDNATSVAIAEATLLKRHIANIVPRGTTMGTSFEHALARDLSDRLLELDPDRDWQVGEKRNVSDFEQYRHLSVLDAAVKQNITLRTEFGREYRIEPDICIGVERPSGVPLLHAVISCKWSMRSDRVQNVRPEGATLIRHRRGRMPHFVVVTAEPLPSRIASIAMTTGELDRVYHIAFAETEYGVQKYGSVNQRTIWEEMVAQGRLRDYNELAETLYLT